MSCIYSLYRIIKVNVFTIRKWERCTLSLAIEYDCLPFVSLEFENKRLRNHQKELLLKFTIPLTNH